MNLISADRDMTWVNPTTELGFGAVGTLSGPVVQTDGIVKTKYGFAKTLDQTTVASGFIRATGVQFAPIEEEAKVFRFKGSVFSTDQDSIGAFGFGWTNVDQGGGLMSVENPVYFDYGQKVDEMVCIEPAAGSPYEGWNLCFFAAVLENQQADWTYCATYVQNLARAPERYRMAVR